MERLSLGLDFHGVIDAMPEEFALLSRIIAESGNEIHILTGQSWDDTIESQLRDWNFKWTHHFSIFDYHKELGTPYTGYYEKFGIPTIDNLAWDRSKADYCDRNNITLHIDDTSIYGDYFNSPFARLWTKNNRPKGEHKESRHIK